MAINQSFISRAPTNMAVVFVSDVTFYMLYAHDALGYVTVYTRDASIWLPKYTT